MVGAFAEFEWEQLRDRTNAGLEAARKAGKTFGRPRAISDDRWDEALTLLKGNPPASVATIAKLLGVFRQTVYTRINVQVEAVPN